MPWLGSGPTSCWPSRGRWSCPSSSGLTFRETCCSACWSALSSSIRTRPRAWGAGCAASTSRRSSTSVTGAAKALVFLPKGVAFFLLAPFPWAVAGLRQIFTLPEMLFFYSLVPAIVRGIRRLIRARPPDSLMVLLVTAGFTCLRRSAPLQREPSAPLSTVAQVEVDQGLVGDA
jgi:hypothetical protein